MSSAKVNGLAELQRYLELLPAKIEANVMRGALRAGAKVILEDAKATAAFVDRTGELRNSLRVSTRVKRGRAIGAVKAGPYKGHKRAAKYAHIVEYGAAAHRITARKAKLLAIGVKSVKHPGTRPRPFLRPALDRQHGQALAAMREYIRNRLRTKHGIDVPVPLEDEDE